ncbi:zinc-binding dehydrogenase [Arenibacter sp. F26102]|uniref:quinone oxidoreductase family protein n=1 Tax=Arenibacter sp. F26102 TaxID=2926416 RepID=UPI001FF1E148|nr:zinc-binding dehydrogenase [Arenibacter sp. F26102]MCK0147096.1 zinc-binding dehydrogenase [Arenibacter sp. F26102]
MKAVYLVKYGKSNTAFEIREVEIPEISNGQVLIKVEAFGINFADVMARLGLYKGAPPLPALLGYEVVGRIEKCGDNVKNVQVGDRVSAITHFGGYAEYAIAQNEVANQIPESMSAGTAVALATQYTTAYFLSHDMANIQEGDKVLVHAAAGGVGTALVQLALHKKCLVFGTCSSSDKIEYLRSCGVQHPINYTKKDFASEIKSILEKGGLDVIFDPVGGLSVRKGYKLLAAGGRLLTYGVSSMNKTKSIFGKIRVLAQFGIYHPLQFLSNSRGMIGVNMLKMGEENPMKVARAMKAVIKLAEEGIIQPFVGGEYGVAQLAEAHEFLESRKSKGKIVVKW